MVSYINESQGLGDSIQLLLKGVFQFAASIVDEALNPANAASTLIVLAFVIGLAVYVLLTMTEGGKEVMRSFNF
jgi:hypothetical protein